MAAREGITVVRDEFKTEAFRQVYDMGRADKYLTDLGWHQNILCFVIYGCAGGSSEAKDCTDQIADAIKGEMGDDCVMPVVIQGYFNRTPCEIPTFKEMIEEEAWLDVGKVASWWGYRQPTNLPSKGEREGHANRRHDIEQVCGSARPKV